jgi:1-acyl-sn-glycerol-3-phosphate acyltransferase
MPLPPLESPSDLRTRLAALARTSPAVGFLTTTLLGFNAAQTASVALLPVSPRTFRAFNRWAANTWSGWCVLGSRVLNRVELVLSGDDPPPGENAIVVMNHQNMPDITFLMDFASRKGRLGDMKWLVKDPIKHVPGVGWGLRFLDSVFVKRNWTRDEDTIRATFAKLRDAQIPVWMISFPEGTRIRPEKLKKSQAYAREHGLYVPEHTLVPRTKGFVATVIGLREHVDAVYDLTLGYENGVPTLWQFVQGFAPRAHLHVRRHPIETLPRDEAALSAWLLDRFREKDQRLGRFYETGVLAD